MLYNSKQQNEQEHDVAICKTTTPKEEHLIEINHNVPFLYLIKYCCLYNTYLTIKRYTTMLRSLTSCC